MPLDDANAPQMPTPDAGVNAAESTNANLLNKQLGAVIAALGDGSAAVITALGSIASAVTASIIGGTTGTTANRVLISKGTTGRALQPSTSVSQPGGPTSYLQVSVAAAGTDHDYVLLFPTDSGTNKPYFFINTTSGSNDHWTIGLWDGSDTNGTITVDCSTFALPAVTTLNGVQAATLNQNTWLQAQGWAQTSLTDASTISWDARANQSAYVLLTSGVGATRALGAPTNLVAGFTYILRVQQSSTGSNALTYNGVYKWPGGVAPVLSTANNAIDILTFVSDGTNMYGVAQKAFS